MHTRRRSRHYTRVVLIVRIKMTQPASADRVKVASRLILLERSRGIFLEGYKLITDG
jgi:hypothetical protein